MRIRQNKNTKKAIIVFLVFVALTAAGIFAWSIFKPSIHTDDRPENTVDYNPPTDVQKAAGDQAKKDFIERVESDSSSSSQPTSNNLNVVISSASQSNQIYQIRIMIPVTNEDGRCTLQLTKKEADDVLLTADTQILGSYAVCKGFDIPVDSMQKGVWHARVAYKGSSGQGAAEKDIEVR